MTKTRIVTHNAGFHADDVFGAATLMLLLGKENVEVIRSRDQEVIDSGDYVLDVGNVYDPEKNRFDHHQAGGAGVRANGIPYAAFGLVWKKFGAEVGGSQDIANKIDEYIVQPMDAGDNGVTIYELSHPSKVRPLLMSSVLSSFESPWGEVPNHDKAFTDAVEVAREFLLREIAHVKANMAAINVVKECYEKASDKSLIVIETETVISRVLIANVLCEYPEPIYFVRQHEDGRWQVVAVSEPYDFFERRKSLPESWAGKRDAELVAVTGVPDSVFCHNARFMAVAESKEGALKLAELALEAKS